MNKILLKRLWKNNFWMFLVTIGIFGIMALQNVLLNIFCASIMSVIILYKTFYFLPLRYMEKGEKAHYDVYKLLPVKMRKMDAYNGINATIWSLVAMIVLALYCYSMPSIHYDRYMLCMFLLVSFIPLWMILIDTYIIRLNGLNYSFILWLFWMAILLVPVQNKTVSNKLFVMFGMMGLFLIVSLVINVYDKKIKSKLKNYEWNFFLDKRLLMIQKVSQFRYGARKRYFDGGFAFFCGWWLVMGDTFSRVFSIIILNIGLILILFDKYYENETLLKLLPISLKEKKASCNIFCILYLIGVNILISCLLMYRDGTSMDLFVRNVSFLSSFAILTYSLMANYRHHPVDFVVMLFFVLLFIVCIYFVITHFTYSLLLFILLISFVLLGIDYVN